MRDVYLLDCTLRDGGFINDWNFGLNIIRDILYRLDKAKVDIIEVGFLDDRRPADPNHSMQPGTKDLQCMFKNMQLTHSMLVAMIDYGTCSIDNIEECEKTRLDGMRVIFKKKDIDGALRYCKQLKDKGYKVFVQPVSITSYSDSEMTALVEKVNALMPYGMSLVDTYGLLLKKELLRFFNLVDSVLSKEIRIGYHAHNNFQLAYANCIELMEIAGSRKLLVDGSVYGMGKGAGNANTEMLALYMNHELGKSYDIDPLLEIIDVDIMGIYEKHYWGYSLQYYLAASNDCHPTYVKYLLDKKTLSVRSINAILAGIDKDNKLSFNQELIDKKYFDYQKNSIDDAEACAALSAKVAGKDILVIVAGESIAKERQAIDSFINEHNPIVFAVNFIPADYRIDFTFVTTVKRYRQFLDSYYLNCNPDEQRFEVLASSNITRAEVPIDWSFNYAGLLNEDKRIIDNSTLLLINLLKKVGVKELHIAGFDGFDIHKESNFAYSYLDFTIPMDIKVSLNTAIKEYLADQKDIVINFITPSVYIS